MIFQVDPCSPHRLTPHYHGWRRTFVFYNQDGEVTRAGLSTARLPIEIVENLDDGEVCGRDTLHKTITTESERAELLAVTDATSPIEIAVTEFHGMFDFSDMEIPWAWEVGAHNALIAEETAHGFKVRHDPAHPAFPFIRYGFDEGILMTPSSVPNLYFHHFMGSPVLSSPQPTPREGRVRSSEGHAFTQFIAWASEGGHVVFAETTDEGDWIFWI